MYCSLLLRLERMFSLIASSLRSLQSLPLVRLAQRAARSLHRMQQEYQRMQQLLEPNRKSSLILQRVRMVPTRKQVASKRSKMQLEAQPQLRLSRRALSKCSVLFWRRNARGWRWTARGWSSSASAFRSSAS